MRSDLELYHRDCKHCWQYMYHEEGEFKGQVHVHRNEPLRRPPGSVPPCLMPVGCKKGTIDEPSVLTQTNVKALMHYRECRAVLEFPDDPIVRQNAAIISEVERMLDRVETAEVAQVMKAVAMRGVL